MNCGGDGDHILSVLKGIALGSHKMKWELGFGIIGDAQKRCVG